MLVRESHEMFGVGPLLRGGVPELHQADFLRAPPRPGMEMALAPNDGLNEGRFHTVTPGGRANRAILAAFQPALPPPVRDGASCEKHEEQNQD